MVSAGGWRDARTGTSVHTSNRESALSAPDQRRLLRAYISDHLQLIRAGHDLACRTRRREPDGELGSLLDAVADELREQESVAIAFLRQLGAGAPWLRLAIGAAAEKIGRLKPNGRFLQASPLALVFELEVLEAMLESASRFWRVLDRAGVANELVVRRYADASERFVPTLERNRLRFGATALRPDRATA
jgi:hypothetical protein